jgi:hypothetical protein
MEFTELVETVGIGVDAAGIAAIALGTLIATVCSSFAYAASTIFKSNTG